jgi:hypothetical protein
LVEVPIKTPRILDMEFPVLAYWTYGLGRSVAYTSDAGDAKTWYRDWAESGLFPKFWEQVLDWSMRPVESPYLSMTADYREGKIKVVVEARTERNEPDTALTQLRAQVTYPGVNREGTRRPEVKFEQRNSGVYEAEFKAEEAGSYFIAFQAVRKVMRDGKEVEQKESVRASVTIPYAPEFADMESNPDLLERLREATNGRHYADDDRSLADAARSGIVFRAGPPGYKSLQPIWYWLVFAAAFVLFLDVAVRRIAFERLDLVQPLTRWWQHLRGQEASSASPEYLARLQSRKAQIGETLEQGKAARRYVPGEGAPTEAPPGADVLPTTDRPATPSSALPPTAAAEQPPAEEDYAARLLRAKQEAMRKRGRSESDDGGKK